jgi:hypothetical protein
LDLLFAAAIGESSLDNSSKEKRLGRPTLPFKVPSHEKRIIEFPKEQNLFEKKKVASSRAAALKVCFVFVVP